jgi:hypothetical protein
MITYREKGGGLHGAIAAAGHWLREEDGVWISSDDAAVQAIIDGYPLAACQAEICAAIDAHAAARRDAATAGVSASEMASWPVKRAEALAHAADPMAGAAPVLAVEAAARGVPLDAVVARVLANAQALATLEATIAGVAGRHKDAVRATQSFAAALAYDWSTGWP